MNIQITSEKLQKLPMLKALVAMVLQSNEMERAIYEYSERAGKDMHGKAVELEWSEQHGAEFRARFEEAWPAAYEMLTGRKWEE